MEEQTGLAKLDSLLVQLALETRELAQKKDDLKQQVQICRDNIDKRKNTTAEIQKSIERLEDQIQQKQNTVKCYKKNLNSLRGTDNFLLQYEKTLEAELQRRRDSCDEDMKMFEERIENYRKIYQQHKEEYYQNPLATKLLKIQGNTEEIKERIRVLDEKIMAKEKELETLQGRHITCDSGQTPTKLSTEAPQDDVSSDFQPQGTGTEQNQDQIDMMEKTTEVSQDWEESCDEANALQTETTGSTIQTKPETKREEIHEAEQRQQQTAEVEATMKTSGCHVVEKRKESLEAGVQQDSAEVNMEEDGAEGATCSTSSPPRMRAILNTPTFSINNSPGTSPGGQERSETPAFCLSLNSGPSTPSFSGFSCGFDLESNQQEETPFTFTSSYFSNKKSPDSKLPGFLFEDLESCPEEGFTFSFSSKSPQPNSASQERGASDNFPFTFDFEKF